MTVAALLLYATEIFLVLASVLALFDFLRHRDSRRRDTALMFGSLALTVVLIWASALVYPHNPILSTLTVMALLSQPFLLVRVVAHYRPVARWIRVLAGLGMLASWLAMIVFSTALPLPLALLIVIYFALVDAYAGFVLVQGAIAASGDAQRRLAYAAAGSVLLALVLALAGAGAAFPDAEVVIAPLSRLAGLLAAIAYYMGFSPPGWIREVWQGLRLGNQAVLVVAGATLLVALITAGAVIWQLRGRWADQLAADQQQLGALVAESVGQYINGVRFGVNLTAGQSTLRDAVAADPWDGSVVQPAVDTLASESQLVLTAFVLDPNGVMRATSSDDKSPIGRSFAEREYFRAVADSGEPHLSNPFLAGNNRPTFVASAPIFGADGRLLAVFCASFDLTQFTNAYSRPDITPATQVVIVSQSGLIAGHPDANRLLQPASTESDYAALALAGQAGVAVEQHGDNPERLVAYVPESADGWAVLVSTPTADAFGPLSDATLRAGVLVLGLIVLLSLAGAGVAAWLFRPLRQLAFAAERFGAGRYDVRVTPAGATDVRQLAHQFNAMADAVGAQAASLEEQRQLAERQAQEHKELFDLASATIAETSAQGIADQVMGHAGRLLSADCWALLMPAAEGGLEIVAAGGADIAERIGKRIPEGRGISRRVWQSASPELINDTRTDPDHVAILDGVRSKLVVPIVYKRDVLGILNFDAYTPSAFNREDLVLAQIIAAQAALALERARLVEQLREQNTDLNREVEERRRAETALARLVRRTESIFESVGEGLYGLDTEGNCTFANPAAARLLGSTVDELIGQPMHALIHHTRADGTPYPIELCPTHQTLRDGATHHVADELYWRRDGASFPVDYVCTPLNDDRGELIGTVIAFRDITERHAFTEQLQRQNEQLEEASRHKSEFLANMSHELRTPLNAINGFSQLLLVAQPGEYDESTRNGFLQIINDSGQHLLALINDILDLAKVESGRMELRPERIDVSGVISRVVATVEPLAVKKNIMLASEADGAGEIHADEGKVKQILYNLVSNAIKFTPDGGAVAVLANRLPDSVEITVADTGVGIAKDDQEKIFQEFVQLDAGADRRYEGTGLGLALTRRLVELHGGTIWVESAEGQGSQFHVRLPLVAATTPRSPLPAISARVVPMMNNGKPKVLVVEDDERSATLLATYLSRGGYQAVVASDGHQALALAKSLRPSAITLDIMLPELDGWEVLRSLKLDDDTREIPVVVTSVVDDQQLGYALGATDYLVKPINDVALLDCLARYMLPKKKNLQELEVLIVDDDPIALDLLSRTLLQAGYTVLRASGGMDAIRLARDQHPDVMLLDIMMPEVNGFDVVTALKMDAETRDIVIFIVTAKDLTAQDKHMLNGGVSAYFEKGNLVAEDLLQHLAAVTRQRARAEG